MAETPTTPRLSLLLLGLQTAIQAINALGSYALNFSPEGVVQIGEPTPKDGPVPAVWIWCSEVVSSDALEAGSFYRNPRVRIEMHLPASDSTNQNRHLAAINALHELLQALEIDRQTGEGIYANSDVGLIEMRMTSGKFSGHRTTDTGPVRVHVELAPFYNVANGMGL